VARDHRRLAAIVSLDVVGYSRLMGVDDSGTLAALKAHRRELIDPKIAEHDGRIVKTTGDGLLLEFSSVVDAVRCAVEVQRGMAERNAEVAPDKRLDFRIGINVGDIIIDGDDIFGDGVNVAARLEALADPGGICVSRNVRDQVLDKLSFAFEDLGAREVKNIARPVDVYRVSLDAESPARAVPKPEQRPAPLARRRWGPAHAVVGVAAALAVGLGAWTAYRAYLQPAVVAPYSAQDRRMTFAVLPFQAPAEDKEGAKVATAMTEAAIAVQESKVLWALVAPRRSVEQALTRHTGTRDLAADLDVHFLIRGNVTRAASGYDVEMLVVDGATERVLGTRSLALAPGALTPRRREELDSALGGLTFNALTAEVERARSKPVASMDVRDLSFRAYADWGRKKQEKDEKGAYIAATDLLNRALALAPDDPLALSLTARVNLCDCVMGWSKNVEEQQAIGAAALEKYLARNPDSPSALEMKAQLFALRARYEESLLIADAILKRDPESSEALALRAYDLSKLGRPQEALTAVNELLERGLDGLFPLAAAVHYQLGQFELAAQMARKAITNLDSDSLGNPRLGAVGLTLVAAEARLEHLSRAKAALADFHAAVPGVRTIHAIRKWMHPGADLASYEPLYEGLRLAGVPD
jgi:class 3 adenylate cyclase/tetratricopeptide (TPR) repeat protein/TolB-like protein